MLCIISKRKRPLEPSLIALCSIRVHTFDEIPCIPGLFGKFRMLCEHSGKIFHRHRADRLIWMRAGKHERMLWPVSNLQAEDRMSCSGCADRKQLHLPRIARRKLFRARVQFRHGEKFLIIRYIFYYVTVIHTFLPLQRLFAIRFALICLCGYSQSASRLFSQYCGSAVNITFDSSVCATVSTAVSYGRPVR